MTDLQLTPAERAMTIENDQIAYLWQLQGVYDGWSVAVMKDGRYINRWGNDTGEPIKGYERRWQATDRAIREATGLSTFDAMKPRTGDGSDR